LGGAGAAGGMGGMSPFGMGGTLTTVSEAQLTSGLVELSIYGIVSLYERYDPAKDTSISSDGAKDGAKEPDTAKEKDKDEPKEKSDKTDKKDGMTEATNEPKKRIRRRAA